MSRNWNTTRSEGESNYMKTVSKFLTMGLVVGLHVGTQWGSAQETDAQKQLTQPAETQVVEPTLAEVIGIVSLTKNEMGSITAAVLKTGEGAQAETIDIKLDSLGKRLAWTVPENKPVKVSGTITEAGGKKTIAVQKFAVAPEPAADKPAQQG
jgi:hypothetical protein